MKKPNFFIVGAPKCGTTSLAHWLDRHPDVYFSPRKEPMFFDYDWPRTIRTWKDYEYLFKDAQPSHIAVGEASTRYLYSCQAVPRILEYSKDARFIVCLRNPIDMAPALHSELLYQGHENVTDFERAWHLQEARAAGHNIPRTVASHPDQLQYGPYCKLGEQVERLYETVPSERVACVVLQDMRESPQKEYDRILSFLGVERKGDVVFSIRNSSKRTKSSAVSQLARAMYELKIRAGITRSFGMLARLRSLNSRKEKREVISPELRSELVSYFREDVQVLSDILNRDLREWLQ